MVLKMSGSICLNSPSQTIMDSVMLTKATTPAVPERGGYLMNRAFGFTLLQRTAMSNQR